MVDWRVEDASLLSCMTAGLCHLGSQTDQTEALKYCGLGSKGPPLPLMASILPLASASICPSPPLRAPCGFCLASLQTAGAHAHSTSSHSVSRCQTAPTARHCRLFATSPPQ